MHNMLDHDREELEQITPYVLSRPKIFKMTAYWKQDDPDGYLSACYRAVMIPSFLPNLVYFLPASIALSLSNETWSQETVHYFRPLSLM